MRPTNIARSELLLRRELKILEHRVKAGNIEGRDAKIQGHNVLEDHYELIIADVNNEVEQHRDLPPADPGAPDLLERLEKAKRDWSQIVDDLLDL